MSRLTVSLRRDGLTTPSWTSEHIASQLLQPAQNEYSGGVCTICLP
jgi:hypothetical protein